GQQLAAQSLAFDALTAQDARGATATDGAVVLVADGNGDVYLGLNAANIEVVVPFSGTAADDPAVEWRSALFEVRADVEGIVDASDFFWGKALGLPPVATFAAVFGTEHVPGFEAGRGFGYGADGTDFYYAGLSLAVTASI